MDACEAASIMFAEACVDMFGGGGRGGGEGEGVKRGRGGGEKGHCARMLLKTVHLWLLKTTKVTLCGNYGQRLIAGNLSVHVGLDVPFQHIIALVSIEPIHEDSK